MHRAHPAETGKVGNIERQNVGHTMDKRCGRQSCIVRVLAPNAFYFDESSPTLQQFRALGKNGEPKTQFIDGTADDGRIPAESVHIERTFRHDPELNQNLRSQS